MEGGMMSAHEAPKPTHEVVGTPEYHGFKNVKVTKVNEELPWKPATEVEVTLADGSVKTIDANTPFFVFKNQEGKELTVSAAAAGHIDGLHIHGEEPGSQFDVATIDELMALAASKIPEDVASTPGVSAFSVEMGKSMGLEGIASVAELQAEGVLSEDEVGQLMALKDEVIQLNMKGTKEEKDAFVTGHVFGKVSFKLIRGDVLVPCVDTAKRDTTQLFMAMGPGSSKDDTRKTLYTMAPGRNMPRHPNPGEHTDKEGVLNEETFQESANAWFDTVMLTGK